MTGTLGRLTRLHHDGDGCTGQSRQLSDREHRELMAFTADMITAVAHADRATPDDAQPIWDAVADSGGWVARHYGSPGEWTLCGALATYVRTGTPPRQKPWLHASVPQGDTHAAALMRTLAARLREPHGIAAVAEHLRTARAPVQNFVAAHADGRHDLAMAYWSTVFATTTGTRKRVPPLAFTALLVLWAARVQMPTTARAAAPVH